jgi:hypothetical protein
MRTVEKYRAMDCDQYNSGVAGLRGNIALQDSFPNTHIGLLIVIEAQVAISENIGGIFNLTIGQRNKVPPNFRGAFVLTMEHPKYNQLSKSDTKGLIFSLSMN